MLKIEVINLTKFYDKRKALLNINFEIKENEFFALIGSNGSGKTTLVRILLKILKPSSGKAGIFYNGREIKKEEIGFVLEDEMPFDFFSPLEYLKFYAEILKRKVNLEELLKKFNLYEYKDTKIYKLSKGNKRKLCILKALINNPKVLIFDQAFEIIDIETRREIYEFLRKEKEGRIIFITSHDFEFIEYYSTHFGIIKEGKFLGKFKTEELKGKKFSDFYFEKIK
ncbi:MAG: ABC transporter ATP-binding protein [candidate division WOR-3 bacterium]